jgi:hypothetical protein
MKKPRMFRFKVFLNNVVPPIKGTLVSVPLLLSIITRAITRTIITAARTLVFVEVSTTTCGNNIVETSTSTRSACDAAC